MKIIYMKFHLKANVLLISLLVFCSTYIQSQSIIPRRSSNNNYFEYVDSLTGKVVSEYYYDQAFPLVEGMGRVNRNGLWGFINVLGKEIIECKYLSAIDFNEGVAPVSNGKLVINTNYVSKENEKYGVIDKNGNTIIEFKFNIINKFKNGIAIARMAINEEYGWINKNGTWEISPQFSSCEEFDEYGMAKVVIEKSIQLDANTQNYYKYGFINRKGEYIIQPIYDQLHDFINNRAVAFLGNYGFIDRMGNDVIAFKYEYAESFSNDLALVSRKVEDKAAKKSYLQFGYVNEQGQEVIPPSFDNASTFSNKMALVLKNEKFGWIDTKGNFITKNDYDVAFDFSFNKLNDERHHIYNKKENSNNLAIVSKNGFWGAINSNGNEIIPIIHDYIKWEEDHFLALKGNERKYFTGIGKNIINPVSDIKIEKRENHSENIWGFTTYTANKLHLEGRTILTENGSIMFGNELHTVLRIGNKYGLKNSDNSISCPIEFDSLSVLSCQSESIALGFKNKKIYIIYFLSKEFRNKNVNLSIKETDYSAIEQYKPLGSCSKFMRVERAGKFGVIEISNENIFEIVKPIYDDIGVLPNISTLIPVKIGKKWGIIDARTGEFKIPPSYQSVSGFSNYGELTDNDQNVSFIQMKNKWALISGSGQLITDFIFDDVRCFDWGYAAVKKGNKWGYIDTKGNQYLPFIFDGVSERSTEPYYLFLKLNKMELDFFQWRYRRSSFSHIN